MKDRPRSAIHFRMPGALLEHISPHARVATAVIPFLVVMTARVVWGKGRLMSWLITLSTLWFAINVLIAPFSQSMQQDLVNLWH